MRDMPKQLIFQLDNFSNFIEQSLTEPGVTPGKLLTNSTLQEELLIPYCRFDKINYHRTILYKSGKFELLLLGWLPGQESAIHDHAGSIGAMRIIKGTGVETRYRPVGADSVKEIGQHHARRGDVLTVGPQTIHRVALSSEAKESMITLHLYTPPLNSMKIYSMVS
ncbi:MAG: Cysteine dioxygenase type I [Candidatus Kentron sp. G]|nr:MAG: Cysteine dioxygenase type I [Candidatus Kentron sp. G]VFN02566.1 MAG: Cysteine dioxygenase type I [Candidatus Kentron sp. G]VFN04439.1 MAG: Cysteine dioxygenase type I [Candidatus Kentron sp. G]